MEQIEYNYLSEVNVDNKKCAHKLAKIEKIKRLLESRNPSRDLSTIKQKADKTKLRIAMTS